MIKGNDLIVYADRVAIGAAKSCEIDIGCEVTEVSSPGSADWRGFRTGLMYWSVSVSSLVMGIMDNVERVGKEVRLRMSANGEILEGSALCTTWRVTGQRGALAQGSFVFQGSGKLEMEN